MKWTSQFWSQLQGSFAIYINIGLLISFFGCKEGGGGVDNKSQFVNFFDEGVLGEVIVNRQPTFWMHEKFYFDEMNIACLWI